MKKFKLTWGEGSIMSIHKVYRTMTVEAESIDKVDPRVILPEEIKKNIYYIRTLITSETKRNYDYGSWSEFIEAEEEKKD